MVELKEEREKMKIKNKKSAYQLAVQRMEIETRRATAQVEKIAELYAEMRKKNKT